MLGASDYPALQALLQPTALAVQDLVSGKSWTYQALHRTIAQFASALRAHGISRGDRVTVLAKNRAELIFLHLACARLEAIFVPLNWRLAGAEVVRVFEDADPKLFLADAELWDIPLAGMSFDEFSFAAEHAKPLYDTVADQNLPSLVLYTSGTTGHPKGVLLSERNISQSALNFSILGRVTSESAVLCDAPMFHIIGLLTNVRPFLMRGARILVSEGFSAARTLARLGDVQLGVTHYFCVPQSAARLREDPTFDADKLRRLTGIFCGGGPHAPAEILSWSQLGVVMADGYGMSEVGTVSCMPLDAELISARAGSAGVIPPGVDIRIIDEQGEPCAAGEVGEIVVKGDSVSAGYWRLPGTKAATLIDGHWFRTGDIGRLDPDGYLWLVDRKKDMFISGGENVYPAEIEAALNSHPLITECAVIGVPDDRWGEVGHLVIVPEKGAVIELAEISGYLKERIARYKIPARLTLLDQLPRNSAGKLLKSVLREQLR